MTRRDPAIYALTAPAAHTARRLARAWPAARLFLPHRLARPQQGEVGFDRLEEALAANFTGYRGHLVFAAAGIVVRTLAGLLRSKDRDPAVVVLDPAGCFAVSLLSGHLGGANDLARRAAAVLGGQAVITTATDACSLPSLEVMARDLGLKVVDLSPLAAISRRLVEGRPVPVYDPGNWLLPALAEHAELFPALPEPPAADDPRPLVLVHWQQARTPASWLVLRPPCLVAGVGCNRGTGADQMQTLLQEVLARHGLAADALGCLATVDLKQDEPGLRELAARLRVKIIYFPAARLHQVDVPHPSATVEKNIGTKSVCEAAALTAAQADQLLVGKHKNREATVAVALISRGPFT